MGWCGGRWMAKMALVDAMMRFADHVLGRGPDVFRGVDGMDLEGIVSKRVDAPYRAGVRSRDWLKVKCWRRYAFVLGGIERDEDDRVTALLVGSVDGGRLRYEGRVEFGLGRVSSVWGNANAIDVCPFGEMNAKRRTWVEPR